MSPRLAVAALLLAVAGCDCRTAALVDKPEPVCTPETCDGFDEDCNGLVDDGLPSLSCGVGACARVVPSCLGGETQTCTAGAPAEELCNGLDDDCDGEVDEGLPTRACGVGACARTVASCADGQPATCVPGTPGEETCDGLDNDCDGATDQGLPLLSCGVGACARTVASCADGAPQACTAGAPAGELCNGLDDDCDGVADEDLPPRTCGVGACARTVVSCADGAEQPCTPGAPGAEVCDGLDNDCDGDVDEALPPVSCGLGACTRTVLACVTGVTPACTPWPASAEVCDGADNDCDGAEDEDLPPLTCGVGACARTVAACQGGQPRTCSPGAPSAELCDGLDNDCDGTEDEDLAPLTCGVGECARTVTACVGGAPRTCTPGGPSADVCDGLDNDCDGTADDDGICQVPVVMCPGALSATVGTTVTLTASATDADGTIVAVQWTVTSRPGGSTAQPATPAAATTTFSPDRAGDYTLSFCARDNAGTSTCCTTALATTVCTSPPPPPVSTACGRSWDGRPLVQFAPVPTGLTYQLALPGDALVLATANEGANYLRPATRIAAGGPEPGLATSLEVRACRASDPSCCSTPSTLSVDVVEGCSTPTAPTAANVVISEYIASGEGTCPSVDCVTQDTCQAGESVEITNLSNCPVSLDGHHFAYRNASATPASSRWMNFGPTDVIPPRGVYVAIRNRQYAPSCRLSLGAESAGLYGLRISPLTMLGSSVCSGWFNNTGGGQSELRLAPGTIAAGDTPGFTPSAAIARIAPYLPASGSLAQCHSIGFDAVDSCGGIVGGSTPTTELNPNQLGRLWHPCDAVVAPVPACLRD